MVSRCFRGTIKLTSCCQSAVGFGLPGWVVGCGPVLYPTDVLYFRLWNIIGLIQKKKHEACQPEKRRKQSKLKERSQHETAWYFSPTRFGLPQQCQYRRRPTGIRGGGTGVNGKMERWDSYGVGDNAMFHGAMLVIYWCFVIRFCQYGNMGDAVYFTTFIVELLYWSMILIANHGCWLLMVIFGLQTWSHLVLSLRRFEIYTVKMWYVSGGVDMSHLKAFFCFKIVSQTFLSINQMDMVWSLWC